MLRTSSEPVAVRFLEVTRICVGSGFVVLVLERLAREVVPLVPLTKTLHNAVVYESQQHDITHAARKVRGDHPFGCCGVLPLL